MVLLDVVVPHGLSAGDELTVEHDGTSLVVVLPPGYLPGDTLPIETPSPLKHRHRNKSSDCIMVNFEVVVPEGVCAGDYFTIETEFGAFEVLCPEGCGEHETINVELPMPGDHYFVDNIAEEEEPSERPSSPPPAFEELNKTGGWPQQKPPSPSSSFSNKPRSRRASKELACGDDGRSDPSHRYKPGQKVQVMRTDGSYSTAVVEYSYDGVFDVLYCVRLEDNGLWKQAVPQDEMYDASDSNDPNYGLHLEALMHAAMEEAMLDQMMDDSVLNYD